MLRFECRVIDEDGEVLVAEHATISPDNINRWGTCPQVDMHVAAALRAAKGDLARRELEALS